MGIKLFVAKNESYSILGTTDISTVLNGNKEVNDFIEDHAKAKQKALDDLHKTFASLSQEDKTFAKQFLNDVENGLPIASDKNLSDYIADYKAKAYNDEIHVVAVGLGVDESKLKALMNRHPTVATIKSFGDYDELFDGLDIAKARAYLESKLNKPLTKNREVKVAADSYLRGIIINGL